MSQQPTDPDPTTPPSASGIAPVRVPKRGRIDTSGSIAAAENIAKMLNAYSGLSRAIAQINAVQV